MQLRAKELQSQECKISQQNIHINNKQTEIDAILSEIAQIQFPTNGSYQSYFALSQTRNTLIAHMEILYAELSALKSHAKTLEEEYKLLHIEYEKIKYLDTKEKRASMKALKLVQQKQTDEIAIMLYTNKRQAL